MSVLAPVASPSCKALRTGPGLCLLTVRPLDSLRSPCPRLPAGSASIHTPANRATAPPLDRSAPRVYSPLRSLAERGRWDFLAIIPAPAFYLQTTGKETIVLIRLERGLYLDTAARFTYRVTDGRGVTVEKLGERVEDDFAWSVEGDSARILAAQVRRRWRQEVEGLDA